MERKNIIIDEQKKWRAVIYFIEDDTIYLGFETNPGGIPIQGNVDDALDKVFDTYEIKTGIDNLEMTLDGGFCVIFYGDCSAEQKTLVVPQIIDYLTNLYTVNKKRFAKYIKKDLK